MAKSCMVNREIKRIRLAKKLSTKRTEIKAVIKNMSLSEDERRDAREKLNKMPRDANPIRIRNRCNITCLLYTSPSPRDS